MFKKRIVTLREEQINELRDLRDHAEQPYVRERAAAILKVGQGASVYQVARAGLLKPRKAETVSAWIDRYLSQGAGGLRVHKGRGRKATFFPS